MRVGVMGVESLHFQVFVFDLLFEQRRRDGRPSPGRLKSPQAVEIARDRTGRDGDRDSSASVPSTP